MIVFIFLLSLITSEAKVEINTSQACRTSYKGDCDLVSAIAYVESRHNPKALNSPEGSYGLMQIRCSTARLMGFTGICSDLFNPKVNIKFAGKYIDYLSSKYTTTTDIIAAYNSGKPIICKNYNPGKCKAGQYYNQAYVDKVFSRYVSIKLSPDQLAKVAIH